MIFTVLLWSSPLIAAVAVLVWVAILPCPEPPAGTPDHDADPGDALEPRWAAPPDWWDKDDPDPTGYVPHAVGTWGKTAAETADELAARHLT